MPIQIPNIKHFIYCNLLNILLFQITIWDYVRYGANDFLGEVVLELGTHPLDDEAEWYTLHAHQQSSSHVVCTLSLIHSTK